MSLFPEASINDEVYYIISFVYILHLFVYIFCLHYFYRALYTICGDAMRTAFLTQQNLLKHLNDAAREVKSCNDSTKKIVLQNHMKRIDLHLKEMATPLPLSLGSMASGIEVENCNYFPSNAVPLKLVFVSNASSDPDPTKPYTIPAIFKIGTYIEYYLF